MVKGEELGMSPIKCINKEGCEELKKIHYDINDVFYNFKKKYISPEAGNEIYQQLVEMGKALSGLNVPQKAQAKKNEILAKLRATVLTLRNYVRTYIQQPGDQEQVQKTINWEVKRLIDAKKSFESYDDPVKYLNEIRFIDRCYISHYGESVDASKLYSFNDELLRTLNGKYARVIR